MKREFQFQIGDEIRNIIIESDGDRYRATVGDKVYTVRAKLGDRGRIDMDVAGRQLRAYVARQKGETYVGLNGQTWMLAKPNPRRSRKSGIASNDDGTLQATMPGLVLDVLVATGGMVNKGDTLVLMEAMKMELRITAPRDGSIRSVGCEAGQVVERGTMLVEMEDD